MDNKQIKKFKKRIDFDISVEQNKIGELAYMVGVTNILHLKDDEQIDTEQMEKDIGEILHRKSCFQHMKLGDFFEQIKQLNEINSKRKG